MNAILQEYILTSESKAVCVLLWLLNNKDENNKIHTTLESIAEECDVTKVTVNRVFQRLYKDGFLTKIRNGQYRLNNI